MHGPRGGVARNPILFAVRGACPPAANVVGLWSQSAARAGRAKFIYTPLAARRDGDGSFLRPFDRVDQAGCIRALARWPDTSTSATSDQARHPHAWQPPPLRSVVIWQRLLHACARPRQPAPDRPTGGEAGPTTPRALSLQLHIMNGCCGRRRRTKRATTPSYYRTGQQPRGARQAGKRSRGIASGRARCGCGLICWRHGGCGRWTTARGQRAGWPG